MAGKTNVVANGQVRDVLRGLSASRDRGEANRARSILLTLEGWTAGRIAKAFGVREDTVRQWRSDFMKEGVDALKARKAPGPPPVKTDAALRVAEPLFEGDIANRPNWTLPRLAAEIERQEGVSISRSQLSKALKKGVLSSKDHDIH